MKNKLPKVSERERDVMQILWGIDEGLTASRIAESGGGLSINTVQAAVRSLMKKGYIEIADIVYSGTVLSRSYKPIVTAEQYAADQLQALRMTTFNFSALNFVEQLNKNDESGMLDELESVIRQKMKQGED